MPIPLPGTPPLADPNVTAVQRCHLLLAVPGHITRAALREALAGTQRQDGP